MYQRKILEKQILCDGVRLGDSCRISPLQGRRKAFTLNRKCIDLISPQYRPGDLSMSYIELPTSELGPFHYRLELEGSSEGDGRFVLKTLKGRAYSINGLAAREAYVERMDRLFIDDNRIDFDGCDLTELTDLHFEHPVLLQKNLLESTLQILLQGETGTGKTHLASEIHRRSGRPGSFVAVNLSSFNPQLIESELFGHRKGAFTGAVSEKLGAFEEAQNGTLFLDEVDSLPLEVQTKLLTFMDSKKFRRVGEVKETLIRTRFVLAAGRPLEPLVTQGLFRRDFYFRLKSGHTIELPSLRNDPKKIKDACQYFALEKGVSFTRRLTEFYESLAWPGNLRQLFGHLEKKLVLSRSTRLDFDHLDEELLLQSSDLTSLRAPAELVSMEDCKIEYVKRALSICSGNVALTARKLRLTEKTVKSLLVKT